MKKIWILGMLIIVIIILSHSPFINMSRKTGGVLFIGNVDEGNWWKARVCIDDIMTPAEAQNFANGYDLVIIGNSSVVNYNITVPVIGIGYGGARFFATWRGETISSHYLSETYLLAVLLNDSLSTHPMIRDTNFTPVLSTVSNATIRWMRNSVFIARLNDTLSSIVVSARATYVLFGMENKEEMESLHAIDLIRNAIDWLLSRPLYPRTVVFNSHKNAYIVGETMNFTVEIRDLNTWIKIPDSFLLADETTLANFNTGENLYRFTEPHEKLMIYADNCAPFLTGVVVNWKKMKIVDFTINGSTYSLINASRGTPLTVITQVMNENNSPTNVTVIYAFAPRVVSSADALSYTTTEVTSYSHMATLFAPTVPQEWRLWVIIPARECGINITSDEPVYYNYTDINIPGDAVLYAKIIDPDTVKVTVESDGDPVPMLKLKIRFNGNEWYQYTDQNGTALIKLNSTPGTLEIQSAVSIVKTNAVRLEIKEKYPVDELINVAINGMELLAVVLILILSRKRRSSP